MHHQHAHQRQLDMLKTALGQPLVDLLTQDDVIEIMANPDGKLWIDTLSQGKFVTEIFLSESQRLTIIKLIASSNNLLINEEHPEISCEIQFASARFQGWIPPVSTNATFTIRKKARAIHTLDDYLAKNWITAAQAKLLKQAICNKLNLLIAGGTGSGKTTFANALLHELRESQDRIIVLEDLPELQISSKDHVTLRTSDKITMRSLVKGCLRMRPDRIIIGEVRDGAALDLLKAWNTGHPGGFCTLHANSASSVHSRLEDLILEAASQVPQRLILETLDVILFMEKQGNRDYKLAEIKCVSDKAKKIIFE
jgi:P-type conjugative transfer ATPase TrbB